ncbi:MAG: hypothetical protein ACRDSK_02275 [Actinophytocola sp.]|uniref:hypothetical protein n=1 Tax=Actinophytocola sp. TaxID=1872138 RepID=UPI003D6C6102
MRAQKPVPPNLTAMPLDTFRELVLWTWSDVYDAWPNGVVDETVTVAGLRPRTVLRRRRRFLRLRWPARPRGLDGLELDPEEMEWLTQRWWSPIAAVRPKQLLAAVTKAVERAGAADPDWRRARRVGFLTWPPP